MRVLLDHPSPFLLAHGGLQIQIEQTQKALHDIGVDSEYVRWWDDTQTADVIHFFGRPPLYYVQLAQQKGIKLVMAELLTATGSRSPGKLKLQKFSTDVLRTILPPSFTNRMNWDVYRLADACIALTPWEAHLMTYLFQAPGKRVHVVPNGVEEVFLNAPPATRGPWLVCTATITERKRIVELAEAAVIAQTPVWIIGKAYSDTDPHAQRFLELARQHPQFIRFEGPIPDRTKLARAYREARGFVLLSNMESLSLSALEAAACECPLLLSDLPWARTTFGETAAYCPIAGLDRTAEVLRQFYQAAPGLKPPPKPLTWIDVAHQLKKVYASL